ncbi:MAG: hypothetical protein KAW56_14030 [Candidatus Marinimicrobia bacterium]|nr:hypothetical protein [Candidatus Neomarinimicrobiota bacterium]
MLLEENLKTIKDAKLDIELLRRDNEKNCKENNDKIEGLQRDIELTEDILEADLKLSGQKKLECKLGWCSYRVMPDKWEYDEAKIINWCKENNQPYYHTKEILERLKLKNAINDNTIKLNKPEDISGLIITPQDPKFNYKLNGGI